MTTYDFDIGIIGGGAAGLTVAAGAAQLGAHTLLIEKEPALGGDCLHYGCVPSKTLIKTARVYHQIRGAEGYGLPPVTAPPVDFAAVANRIRSVIAAIQAHDSEKRFCDFGVRVVFAPARFRDEHTVHTGGRSYSARYWVIATGSSPALPPIAGITEVGVLTNRELFSLERLPASLIILGAGPIGIEMAQAFNRLGTRVSVVNRSAQILGREDPDMAEAVKDALAAEGVRFHLEAALQSVQDLGEGKEVRFKSRGGERVALQGEAVLAALGRRANTEGLGLKAIGVDLDDRGYVRVDARLRTRHRHIFAAGDVIGGYQFTHAAGYEGGIVVANAIFRLPRKVDYTDLPWCTYTDPELASIGLNETRARKAGVKVRVVREAFKNNDRSLAEKAETGTIKLLLGEREKPVGVQIFGPHAGELLGEWVAAFGGGVRLSRMAAAVHPYPTLVEINKRVVGNHLSAKLFSERVRKGLKLFFNLKGRACGGE